MLVVWNVGIISTPEALSGFNNPSLLVIGALFVVVASIENSRLADKASRRVFGVTNTLTSGFFRLMLCAVAMSSFVNNTPVVALLIPVTRDWARARGFDHALLLMPLAFVCSFGGMLTTVGGGTNLLVQGLLYQAGKSDDSIRPFGFFEPGFVGLPLAIAGIGYLLVAAPRLLGAPGGVSGTGRSRDRSEDLLTEVRRASTFRVVARRSRASPAPRCGIVSRMFAEPPRWRLATTLLGTGPVSGLGHLPAPYITSNLYRTMASPRCSRGVKMMTNRPRLASMHGGACVRLCTRHRDMTVL